MQELFRRFVTLAMEFVAQRKTWKERGKRRNHGNAQYPEFPRSWSTRAERELREMDYMFRNRRRQQGERTHLEGAQIQCHWQTVRATAVQSTSPRLIRFWEQYQLYQHEEASMHRTSKRRVMIVSNPDPTDDSEEE